MNWAEWLFVAVCSIITLAMIGTVNLAAGALAALLVGLLLWALFAALPGPDRYRR